ncbi:MAG: ferredoxin [Deltaproteobacteria bacterium]|nr:ferredoxin [Deltaproteobacteria bacterium]
MADVNQKLEKNVQGRYYVTSVCIGCNLCAEIAPENFVENLDEGLYFGHCYVSKQPADKQEEALCLEVMDICPACAIYNDGLKNSN